jgi:ribosome-associated protein
MQQTETDPLAKGRAIVEAALELKAERPVVLAMRELTSYADAFVILTGRSDRQVRAIAQSIIEMLKSQGDPPLGVEGLDDGNWVLIDCNDAIVHVFDPETREQYDLERLWRDAPRIDLGIEGIDPDPEVLRASEAESGDETSGAGSAHGGGLGSSAA